MNVEVPSVYAVPGEIRNSAAVSRKLGPILKIDPKSLAKKIGRWKELRLAGPENRPGEGGGDPASSIGRNRIRHGEPALYPKRALFGHLLGFAGLDNRGLEDRAEI